MKKNKANFLITLTIIMSLSAVVLLPSSNIMQQSSELIPKKSIAETIESSLLEINDNVNMAIFDLPKVYALPMDLSPAPKPNPSKFTESEYEDETISVKCWREEDVIEGRRCVANFAEVTISNPTQLRGAFASRNYSPKHLPTSRLKTSKIASINNAVVAINADFCAYRPNGIVVRQCTLYRENPTGLDTLFIDSEGDFTILNDREAVKNNFLSNHNIYQVFAFGPELVRNGKAIINKRFLNCVPCGADALNPRTAIGQLGHLHYLLCTLDGRTSKSNGSTTNELAEIMAKKGCVSAYNLDGGGSSTLVFNNQIWNKPSGSERPVSDIIYFSSAIPESEWN